MEQKDNNLTKLQAKLAVAAFASGVVIACICLFVVPPPGEISTSAISIVSELLILCGALLGIKVSYDAKQMQFQNDIVNMIKKRKEDTADED